MNKRTLIDLLRAWPWLAGAILATTAVAIIAPYQLGVLVWSLSKLSLGAYLGYWIDRSVYPYARPHVAEVEARQPWAEVVGEHNVDAEARWLQAGGLRQLRRAIIIAAAIIALGLGV